MISELLKEYIPSKSYVEYLESINHIFSDYEEAAILDHVIKDVFLLHEELKRIADTTNDKKLKEQIEDYLNYEKERIVHFCDNREGNYIYVVKTYDEDCLEDVVLAYTRSYQTALARDGRYRHRLLYAFSEKLQRVSRMEKTVCTKRNSRIR